MPALWLGRPAVPRLGARCLRARVVHLAPAQLGALAARDQRRRGVRGRVPRLPRRHPAQLAAVLTIVGLFLSNSRAWFEQGTQNTWQGLPRARRRAHRPGHRRTWPPADPADSQSPGSQPPGSQPSDPRGTTRPEASRRSGDQSVRLQVGLPQPPEPLDDQVLLLAERPPDQVAAVLGAVLVEDLGRDRHHLGALGHGGAERDPVGVPERGHVGGHEVGALRHVHLQARVSRGPRRGSRGAARGRRAASRGRRSRGRARARWPAGTGRRRSRRASSSHPPRPRRGRRARWPSRSSSR